MFQHFHYPFSLRIPPRWKLIHGCLRCATVRLLTHSDDGLVPQCYRAYFRGDVGSTAAHDGAALAKEDAARHRAAALDRMERDVAVRDAEKVRVGRGPELKAKSVLEVAGRPRVVAENVRVGRGPELKAKSVLEVAEVKTKEVEQPRPQIIAALREAAAEKPTEVVVEVERKDKVAEVAVEQAKGPSKENGPATQEAVVVQASSKATRAAKILVEAPSVKVQAEAAAATTAAAPPKVEIETEANVTDTARRA